jgi:galactonate dehydratase
MVAAAASRLGRLLVGEDSSRIEYLWYKVYSSFNTLGSLGFASALLSGVDIALWDLRGKELGLPVYELLGGKYRDDLILYANGWFGGCKTPEDFGREAKRVVNEGHTALKLDPFRQHRVDFRKHGAGYEPADEEDARRTIESIRDNVGAGVEILIDAHGRFDVPTAVRLANLLVPYRIGWFEEPVPPENWDALEQFRSRSQVPVCVGECLYTRWQFRPLLEKKLAEYIMPDVIRTGGISELRRIATMAEAFFVPVSPHDATGPITLIAGAQTMMATANFYRLEIAYAELEQYNRALTPALDVRHGRFHVSDRPGLGHDLRADYIAQAIEY